MSDNKPILIGEAPSKTGDRYHMFPLSGAVAQRMCEMAGIPPQANGSRYGRWTWALYEHFECVNVFERYAPSIEHDWPVRAVQHVSKIVDTSADEQSVVVCLGRKVQYAMAGAIRFWVPGFVVPDSLPFHDWLHVEVIGLKTVTIPHPSGLNRTLNLAEERERCGATLRRAMELAR